MEMSLYYISRQFDLWSSMHRKPLMSSSNFIQTPSFLVTMPDIVHKTATASYGFRPVTPRRSTDDTQHSADFRKPNLPEIGRHRGYTNSTQHNAGFRKPAFPESGRNRSYTNGTQRSAGIRKPSFSAPRTGSRLRGVSISKIGPQTYNIANIDSHMLHEAINSYLKNLDLTGDKEPLPPVSTPVLAPMSKFQAMDIEPGTIILKHHSMPNWDPNIKPLDERLSDSPGGTLLTKSRPMICVAKYPKHMIVLPLFTFSGRGIGVKPRYLHKEYMGIKYEGDQEYRVETAYPPLEVTKDSTVRLRDTSIVHLNHPIMTRYEENFRVLGWLTDASVASLRKYYSRIMGEGLEVELGELL